LESSQSLPILLEICQRGGIDEFLRSRVISCDVGPTLVGRRSPTKDWCRHGVGDSDGNVHDLTAGSNREGDDDEYEDSDNGALNSRDSTDSGDDRDAEEKSSFAATSNSAPSSSSSSSKSKIREPDGWVEDYADIIATLVDYSHRELLLPSRLSPYATEVNASSSPSASTSAATMTNVAGPGKILGKRGRFYIDMWDEDDWIFRYKQGADPLEKWSDMFHNYSENHDGAYREWAVQNTDPVRISKTSWGDDGEVVQTADILAPPVPVSLQHPASWGLHARRGRY
jgi:hypothetical protein